MDLLRKLSDGIFKVEKTMIVIFLSIIFLALTMGVIFRYFFNNPLDWSGEVAVFCLAWVTFIGGSMTIKRQQSAAFTLLLDKLSGSTREGIQLFGSIIVFLFSLFVVIVSLNWLSSPFIYEQRSMALHLPMIIPYLCIPVGFGFMTVHSFVLVLERLLQFKREVL